LNPAADGSRRLGSKAEAGRLANGESRKLAGRYSWKVSSRRKPKGWHEGEAGESVGDASRRAIRRQLENAAADESRRLGL
jgi:hypothetical protein